MKQPGIYALIDPLTHEIRYIGKSTDWPKRSHEHHKPNRVTKDSGTHKTRWIKQLLSQGLKPIIQLIQEFPHIEYKQLDNAEIYWIQYFKSLEAPLTNITPGGEGHPISEETKLKISNKMKLRAIPKIPKPPKPKLSTTELILAHPNRKPIKDHHGNTYLSIKDAARKLNILHTKISAVLHKRKPSAHGYKFYWV